MARALVKAILGPTNTGKTHYALERLCGHSSGMIGFPLRLLAREAYDRVVAVKGPKEVGLITGEERIVPPGARWLLCTAESMPRDLDLAFVAIDETQLGSDDERGHIFTDRLLNARGREETLVLGSDTIRSLVRELVPGVEVQTRPRFSKLQYAAPKKLSRLPPRTAIIAFSADEVYEIAELIRRTRGGSAIVMGNLSPRTRNAQVAMYQAGEVDFLVATDAIGMGLNLDIDQVAFAGLHKFDGTRRRRLLVTEMAQIAGRAGRHQRDGSFGLALRDDPQLAFTDDEIRRIEDHRFPPQHWVYWRNADLDFRSPAHLLESLALPPPEIGLRPAPEADDHAVFRRVLLDINVTGEGATRRLWEACGLPDFRGSGPEFHAQTVSRIFRHIGFDGRHIPPDLIAAEITRLESVQGDIPTLSGRLAGIRLWSYAATRADWLADPTHWAERTRAVEQALSDALHARLTERFVERKAMRLLRASGRETARADIRFHDDGDVTVMGESVGNLSGFHFTPNRHNVRNEQRRLVAAAEARLPEELGRRAGELAVSPAGHFQIVTKAGFSPELHWNGAAIARLGRGRSLLQPVLAMLPPLARLGAKTRDLIQERGCLAVEQIIAQGLKPLTSIHNAAFDAATQPLVRAFLAPLAEAGGVLPRQDLMDTLMALTPDQRRYIRTFGITIGSLGVFHHALLKPEAMRLRAALVAARSGTPMPPLPMAGLGLLDRPSAALAAAAVQAGYFAFGHQMLRHDLLERIARQVHEQHQGSKAFAPDPRLATTLGVGQATFDRVLRAIGFVPAGPENPFLWRWRGLRRSVRAQGIQPAKRRRPRKRA